MSELIQKHDNRATIRWKLLTGVSVLALTAYVSSASVARAEDASRPQIWIELDGQFAMQKNDLEVYNPAFLASSPFDVVSHLSIEKVPTKIWNKGAQISFQPSGSDWVLAASIQYGKIGRTERYNHVTTHGFHYGVATVYNAYQDFRTQNSESHTVVDFKVGRDVGLGKFGHDASSTISLGVRFAQFKSSNHVGIKSQPTNYDVYYPYYRFYASFDGKRKFQGIGPSLSWNASAMIAGSSDDGGISLDWGISGAVLFGRQRMSEHHQTTKNYWYYSHGSNIYQNPPVPVSRSKKVTVPNLGGFAAVSWRYAAAKVSIGYRADMFFGAIDGGIAAAKKENRGFYGPFASISVGIGD